jgi:hypothetical protein
MKVKLGICDIPVKFNKQVTNKMLRALERTKLIGKEVDKSVYRTLIDISGETYFRIWDISDIVPFPGGECLVEIEKICVASGQLLAILSVTVLLIRIKAPREI